jgi:hypothetical protein
MSGSPIRALLDRHLATLRQTCATIGGEGVILTHGLPNDVTLLEIASPNFVSQGMAISRGWVWRSKGRRYLLGPGSIICRPGGVHS